MILATTVVILVTTCLIFTCLYLWQDRDSNPVLSCTANINFNLSDEISPGPVVNGIIYIHLQGDSNGFLELSGIVKWLGNTYPISKRIKITHNLKHISGIALVTVQAVSSLSLEHDESPPGVIEKYLIGDPSLPARIMSFKKIFDNGYLIGNLNSPLMICTSK